MKKILLGLLVAVTVSGCFPVFVPVHEPHYGHHYGHRGWGGR